MVIKLIRPFIIILASLAKAIIGLIGLFMFLAGFTIGLISNVFYCLYFVSLRIRGKDD